MIKETHSRTIVKAIIYRILSVIAIMLISLAMGASTATAGKVGLIVVFLGTAIYYIHDRLWIFSGWHRNYLGIDGQWRSIAKTVIYRLITMTVSFFIAKFFLTDSSGAAVGFALAQATVNMTLFYIVERVFNRISWGRSVVEEK
jgi:uncharacterized membrane protein